MTRPFFKYYIHDERAGYRLQLLGDFAATDVEELSRCWRTARTTLNGRKLMLDLCQLRSVDPMGVEWVLSMAAEGAAYDNDALQRARASTEPAVAVPTKQSWFAKLFPLRGSA